MAKSNPCERGNSYSFLTEETRESDVEVNPEMLAAGVAALNLYVSDERGHFYPDDYIVEQIFTTMFRQMKTPLGQI